MEDRETARMRKYGESKTTRIMMATVSHVTSGLGLRKFQADGFLLTRVYKQLKRLGDVDWETVWTWTPSLSRTNKYSEQCLFVSSRHIEYDVPITDEKNKVMFYLKKNRNPRKKAATDPRIRPRGHRYRMCPFLFRITAKPASQTQMKERHN